MGALNGTLLHTSLSASVNISMPPLSCSCFSAAPAPIKLAAIIIIQTLTFFQLVRAAFCGRNQYILAPMLTLKWSHAFALNLKKKKFQKRTKESGDATASLYIQAKEIRTMKIFLQDYLSFNSCPMGRLPFERLTL